jgi:DNA-binding NtrC family response regulator
MKESAQILVVDDDRKNGEFLEEELSAQGCKVSYFRDPRQALRQFRKGWFHIGILDLKMPHMSGLELFQELRRKDPDIGLIILTGYPSVDTALATLKTGAYDYMKKPYKIEELKKIIHKILEEKGVFLETGEQINQRIGLRIKEFRAKRHWTIARLAAQARLSKSLISQIENGKNSASLVSLSHIARSLKVKFTELVQDL